ncbi:MAG: hypothetical protein AB9888_13545 [Bacteroidales bacterium]
MKLNTLLFKNLVNIPGWRTTRKLVVIESDDWGSIRTPSKEVYQKLKNDGVPVDGSYFIKYDCLESEEDLSRLLEVLRSYRDHNGNYACITANTVTANPDFFMIKESEFSEYYYEPFWITYTKYPKHSRSLQVWKESFDSHLLWPQFHGRDHLNPYEYLKILKENNDEQIAFKYSALLGSKKGSKRQVGFLAAFDCETEEERASFADVVSEGQNLFENAFGFRSKSFIAPTGIRGDSLDEVLCKNGLLYHQDARQWLPLNESSNTIRHRFWGASNKYGQYYWRRNSTFEPTRNPNFDWVGNVLKEARVAFSWGKPLVINSHRVNYMGGIDPENRGRSLRILGLLLKNLLKTYPDVEFISSDQLGDNMVLNPKYFLGARINRYFDLKSKS